MNDAAPSAGSSPDPVEKILGDLLLRLDEEGEAAIERACAAHPAFAREIRDGVDYLRRAGLVDAGSSDDAPPDRLGAYRILRRLGGGGMGVVFLAEDETLGRRVALKVVRPDSLFFEGSRARFRREAEAVARLEHPSIVSLYTFGEENGVPYFAMEHVEGASLADVLRELAGRQPESLSGRDLAAALAQAMDRPAPDADADAALPANLEGAWWEVVCRLILEVARAIEHAHQREILHRDLKPSNLMLSPDGRVRVVDFGLAHAEGAVDLTVSGAPLGSLAYMSPEQLAGRRAAYGPPTDVYGLGVTLQELLALRSPFRGDHAEETRRKIREGRPRALRADYTTLPRDVAVVCARAIDPDPGRRYPTAAALARDLGNLLARKPIEARPQGALVRAQRFAQRRPALAALAVVLTIGLPLVAGLGGFLVARLPELRAAADRRSRDAALEVLDRGYLEAAEGKAARAEASFEEALDAWADLPVALALLLDRYVPAARVDEVAAAYERHADLVRAYPALRWFEVDLLRAQGAQEEAAALAATLPAPRRGIDWYVEGLRRLERYYRGDEAVLDGVLQAFRAAVLNADRPQRMFHLKLIEAALYAGDGELVTDVADAIAFLWPDSAVALGFAGLALWEHDADRGEALVRRALEVDGEFALGWLFVAQADLDAGRFGGALASARRALEIDPEARLARNVLGLAYEGLGDLDAAAAAFRAQAALEPDLAQIHVELGRVLERLGREDEARDAYREAAGLEPLNALPWLRLGELEARAGRTGAARAALEECEARGPEDLDAARDLAAALASLADFDGAARVCRLALDAWGEDAGLRVELAAALAELGAPEEARAELERALEVEPEHPGARAALDALER